MKSSKRFYKLLEYINNKLKLLCKLKQSKYFKYVMIHKNSNINYTTNIKIAGVASLKHKNIALFYKTKIYTILSAILIHELGHIIGNTKNEVDAWNIGRLNVPKYLIPKNYNKIKLIYL